MSQEERRNSDGSSSVDLLVFSSRRCGLCWVIVPMALEYARTAKLSVRVVDVHSDDQEDRRLCGNIRWVPTLIFRGREIKIDELAALVKMGGALMKAGKMAWLIDGRFHARGAFTGGGLQSVVIHGGCAEARFILGLVFPLGERLRGEAA